MNSRKIKNFDELSVSQGRKDALEILEAGLWAIDTKRAVSANVRLEGEYLTIKDERVSLKGIARVVVVGVGKCALDAAAALEDILGDRISDGIVMDVRAGTLKKLKTYVGSHPLPAERNVNATRAIIELLSQSGANDLIIFLISGGGSALLCQPKNLTCAQESEVLDCLFRSGADIRSMNILRKHLSLARGGFLAKYAYPAKAVSLIFSDIPDNRLEFVSSGPTVQDSTTVEDAKKIVERFSLAEKCGFDANQLIETPKEDKYFENVKNILFISNTTALEAMANKAGELGYAPEICTGCLSGEAKDIAAAIIDKLHTTSSRSVLLYGGETAVMVGNGTGKGGRNQELALAGLAGVQSGETMVAAASDGRDNSDYAGAICDIITKEKTSKLGLDANHYLEEHDSYNFFTKTGDRLLMGDTGSNVSDLIVAIKE